MDSATFCPNEYRLQFAGCIGHFELHFPLRRAAIRASIHLFSVEQQLDAVSTRVNPDLAVRPDTIYQFLRPGRGTD